MLENSFAAFEGQVQPIEFRIVFLEFVNHAKRLQVVFETTEIGHAVIQRILARMAEGRVSKVMGQTDGLGQFFVQVQRAGGGARYLRDLERMGQPSSVEIAFVVDEDLGLVDQSTKRGGMHDAIAIALKFGSILRGRLRIAAPSGILGMGRIRRQRAHVTRPLMLTSAAMSSGPVI
jgi:hypothetical protein